MMHEKSPNKQVNANPIGNFDEREIFDFESDTRLHH